MTKVIKEDTESENEDISDIELDSNDGDEDLNIPSLINHFFTNEEGENIAQVLTQLKKSLDTQNKLIYKLLQGAAENKNK